MTGGAGDDQFDFSAGSFHPELDLRPAGPSCTDFQGAGVAGGDVIRLTGDSVAFVGQLDIDPEKGAALPGAGNGIIQLGYTQQAGNT